MNRISRIAFLAAALAMANQAAAQATLYERDGFQGRSMTTSVDVSNLGREGFNDRASSVTIRGDRTERWEVCEDRRYRGRCVILRRGDYPSLAAMGLNDRVSSVRTVSRNASFADDRYAPAPAQASQAVFYENEGFKGRSFSTDAPLSDLRRAGFNDRASSVVVSGERWEVCQDSRYRGRCVVLRPGQYASLAAIGLDDRISSTRAIDSSAGVDDRRYAPPPVAVYDYGRRPNERVYEGTITSVRAVLEESGQRCWIEREQVVQERSAINIPGALIGGLIGGVLGHQVGGGRGKDVATGVGAAAGAVIGANTGGSTGEPQAPTQNVQHCSSSPAQAHPAYWDVTYVFRGIEHRVQMTTPPGATVSVNEQGEPRI